MYRLEFALRTARDLDEVARATLAHLARLSGAVHVGVGFDEGAGRRLRYAGVAREDADSDAPLPWRHIDGYDDVPLVRVVRTGSPLFGTLDELEASFPLEVDLLRQAGHCALAALPLPGAQGPIGGLYVVYDDEPEFSGEERRVLEAVARRTGEAVRRVRTRREGHRSDTPEDWAVVEETFRASVLLDPDPRSSSAARRFLRDNLTAWGVSETILENAQLCVSELVTNVIMHAGTPAHLTVHLEEGSLGVLVRDGGDAMASAALSGDDDPLRVSGRGLTLIDALADRWGSHADAQGTIAWFVLELGDDDSDDSSEQTG